LRTGSDPWEAAYGDEFVPGPDDGYVQAEEDEAIVKADSLSTRQYSAAAYMEWANQTYPVSPEDENLQACDHAFADWVQFQAYRAGMADDAWFKAPKEQLDKF
jgi:hypothetical protein